MVIRGMAKATTKKKPFFKTLRRVRIVLQWLTVDSLQSCMGPVAMILTGFVIGDYSFKTLVSLKKVYIATALRLLILPVVIITILLLCGANKYIVTLALFAYATPLGLNTVVFPAVYDGDTQTGNDKPCFMCRDNSCSIRIDKTVYLIHDSI